MWVGVRLVKGMCLCLRSALHGFAAGYHSCLGGAAGQEGRVLSGCPRLVPVATSHTLHGSCILNELNCCYV